MENERFDQLIRRVHVEASRRRLLHGGLGVAAATAVALLGFGLEESAAKKKGKKKRVCTCPTAEAVSCTQARAKKKKAKKLASQACNYAGNCQPGRVGSQCLPSTTTTPAPGCPSGQSLCGATCVDLQSE